MPNWLDMDRPSPRPRWYWIIAAIALTGAVLLGSRFWIDEPTRLDGHQLIEIGTGVEILMCENGIEFLDYSDGSLNGPSYDSLGELADAYLDDGEYTVLEGVGVGVTIPGYDRQVWEQFVTTTQRVWKCPA